MTSTSYSKERLMRTSFRPWQALLLCPVLLTLPGLVPAGKQQTERPKGQIRVRERATLRVRLGVGAFVTFSPDGKTVTSFGDQTTVKLWEVITGKERASFRWQSVRGESAVLS